MRPFRPLLLVLALLVGAPIAPHRAEGSPSSRPLGSEARRPRKAKPRTVTRRTKPKSPARYAKPTKKAKKSRARMRSDNRRPDRRGPVERGREAPRNTAPAGATELERRLQARLDEIMGSRWLKSAINGVYVLDTSTGRVLYAHGEERQLNPASNAKLVSTAAALDALGSEYTYQTRLLARLPDAAGVIRGDLYLRGTGDPTLDADDLQELAEALRARGVTRVTGDVVLTDDEARDVVGHAYVVVSVRGGDREGELPTVTVSPDSAFVTVDIRARTTSRGRRARIAIRARVVDRRGGERLRVKVTGKIRPRQRVLVTRRVPRPALFTGHTLRAHALLAGVAMEGSVRIVGREAAVPEGAVELASRRSVPLRALAARINKPSNNFLADRLIMTVGAARYGGAPTMAKGRRAMVDYMESIGIPEGAFRLDNGSGLSYVSHLSARQVAEVLLAAARDPRFGSDFVASLAIGGRDGTLRGRFAGHPSAGRVYGKTGTLNGVAALSGFVRLGGDDNLCFAILTNGFRNRRKHRVRARQVDMVDAMHEYLVARRAARPDVIPPVEAPAVAADDEPALDAPAPVPEGPTPAEVVPDDSPEPPESEEAAEAAEEARADEPGNDGDDGDYGDYGDDGEVADAPAKRAADARNGARAAPRPIQTRRPPAAPRARLSAAAAAPR